MRSINAEQFAVSIIDGQDSVCLVLEGALNTAAVPSVRAGLAKCLAEQPVAVVIDLLGLDLRGYAERPGRRHRAAHNIVPLFLLMRRDARRASGVPLIVVAEPAIREALQPYRAGTEVVATRSQADAVAAGFVRPERWRRQQWAATPWVGALARDFVTNACAGWDLPHLLYAARNVASELVDNAVRHARTDIVLTVAQRRFYLVVQVQDNCPTMPRLLDPVADDRHELCWRGRGLETVSRLATGWGARPTVDGKIVWATLIVGGAPAAGEPTAW